MLAKTDALVQDAPNVMNETPQFPFALLWVIVAVCVTPISLNAIGFDFASAKPGLDIEAVANGKLSGSALVDAMFHALAGGLQHGLLEWSAVTVAGLTVVLAFSHFAMTKEITTPIIGLALFCSGTMDGFHTLAATRLIDAVAENANLIPFTWALSRGFNAGILMVGVLLCLSLHVTNLRAGVHKLLLVGVSFAAVAYLLITYSANSADLPQTQYPGALITRPFDVFPLILFMISAPFFWRLYKQTPNLLTASLVIALLPEIVLEVHMAFGSSQLFDNNFNIAHFLKIFAYAVPFIGMVLDYIRTYRLQNETQTILEERERGLAQANIELEEFAYRTSHDLRSPIVSSVKLLALTEQAIRNDRGEMAFKTLNHAQISLGKLDRLIQDILALTKMKNLEEEAQKIDVGEVVDEALIKMEYMDNFDRLDIRRNLKFGNLLSSKKSHVTLIVENLISNAIKYQDPAEEQSSVEISTQREKDHFVFEVKDNGLGVPKDQQDKLFSMFARFHPKVSFGSGLGLYLIGNSARAINAAVTFHENGKGSIFRLRVPV